jgi:preprotein translocase subunit SecA
LAIQTAQFEMQMDKDTPWIKERIANCDEVTRMAIAEEHLGKDPSVDRLRRYERQLSQQYARTYRILRQMQIDERKADPSPTEPAQQAAQVPDPPPDTAVQNKPKPAAKAGRNELCPCGSNKKFKRCCLNGVANTEKETECSGQQPQEA